MMLWTRGVMSSKVFEDDCGSTLCGEDDAIQVET